LMFSNEGNIKMKPEVTVDIWDQEQNSIVKTIDLKGDYILPTKSSQINFNLNLTGLDVGQYWANVKVPACFAEETITFDVLDIGALKADLALLKMFSKAFAKVGETLPVIVNFKNTGEKSVDAQFRGQVSLDGKVIQILESEKISVEKGETNNFTLYFTPVKIGRYVASGRIFYDKKRTFESSTTVNVAASDTSFKQILMVMIYIAVLVIILILFFKIRKERRDYMNKIRSFRA
jgi:hypothetical protein